MNYSVIEVPDMNDSVSRISLQGSQYQLRFTWNDTGGYWMFSILNSLGEPLLIGVKIVPNFRSTCSTARRICHREFLLHLPKRKASEGRILPMARHNSCLFRHDAGTNHPVKSILILNKYLRAGLTIRSQKVPDKFPYTFTGKVRV